MLKKPTNARPLGLNARPEALAAKKRAAGRGRLFFFFAAEK
jgi:hypothetical protein